MSENHSPAPPPKLVFKFGCHLGGGEVAGYKPPFSLAVQKYNSLSAFMTVGLLLAGLTDLLKGRLNQSEAARWYVISNNKFLVLAKK